MVLLSLSLFSACSDPDTQKPQETGTPDTDTGSGETDSGTETDSDSGTTETDTDSGGTETDTDSGTTETDTDSGTTETDTGSPDEDGDGWTVADGDCDDGDASVNPDADEVCDEVDNDCDSQVDDEDEIASSAGSTWYYDADGDGYGDGDYSTRACEQPEGYVVSGADCNDADPAIKPGGTEICDEADNDCDGSTDEAGASDEPTWYADADGDGYGVEDDTEVGCAQPAGYADDAGDCDDGDPAIHPGADEGDCTDPTDYNCDGSVGYDDGDGDGWAACAECDDADAAVNPDAVEVCDDLDTDEDCSGAADDEDTGLGEALSWYRDLDADGWASDSAAAVEQCEKPTGNYTTATGDCDDYDDSISPGATEVCDAYDLDEDCDGASDDDDGSVDPSGATAFYKDADSDGYGDESKDITLCDAPSGYVENGLDCDDGESTVNPAAEEICDLYDTDEDCDDLADDEDPGVSDAFTLYLDADGDGFGDPATALVSCSELSGWVDNGEDCDDEDPDVNPDAEELCDGAEIDEDCDGTANDDDADAVGSATWYRDADNDGYGSDSSTMDACSAPAGYVATAGDCDDASGAISPAATEICDASDTDEDCDGVADDSDGSATGKTSWYTDADGDGYGLSSATVSKCDRGATDAAVGGDCNDASASISPGAAEVCDAANTDEDCDGAADDADSSATGKSASFRDADGDGYGGSTATTSCDLGSGYVANDDDCNDASASISPAATEICDASNTDEDCDGSADDSDSSVSSSTRSTWYLDADSDGYGLSTSTSVKCDKPSGYSATSGDCNDGSSAVSPAGSEVCDAADTDEDCDGLVDDADSSVSGRTTWYTDADGDGYGLSSSSSSKCNQPSGTSSVSGDCNDGSASISPAATETCDAANTDEDCDGAADDADSYASGKTSSYRDADGDGYGSTTATTSCDLGSGYVLNDDDCNDASASVSPASTEVCDSADTDEDCDGSSDDTDSSVSAASKTTWYVDADADGYGVSTSTSSKCDKPSGYSASSGDCNDGSASISPAATETCDASDTDEDCDGLADDSDTAATGKTTWYTDADSDGYGDTSSASAKCNQPSGTTTVSGDCDDGDSGISPADVEICDAENDDEDCDGLADDSDPSASGKSAAFRDADGDGYGGTTSTTACDLGSGYVANDDDCNDSLASVSPGGQEVCDSSDTDEDCDGLVEDADPTVSSSTKSTWYRDSDNDGYGTSSTTSSACDKPTSYVSTSGDCDDANSSASPATAEKCTTAYDDDCDGAANEAGASDCDTWYYDADFDNYGTSASVCTCLATGYYTAVLDGDCDDGDDETSPAGVEICGDGIDQDCDGRDDVCATHDTGPPVGIYDLGDMTTIFTPTSSSTYYGAKMSGRGEDFNGDGKDDFVVGEYDYSYGYTYVTFGPERGVEAGSSAANSIVYGGSSSYADVGQGVLLAPDDDGGSASDLFISYDYSSGSYVNVYEGAGAIATGTTVAVSSTSYATAIWTGSSGLGIEMSTAGDLNNDGYNDVLIGYGGAAYLVYGPFTSGSNSISTVAGATISAGPKISGGGYNDADDYADVLTGYYTTTNGNAYLFYGSASFSGSKSTSSANVAFTGESSGDYAGFSLDSTGDFNGDGLDDVLIGAPYNDEGGTSAGKAYVIFAPFASTESLASADVEFTGEYLGDYAGYSVTFVEDLDGDGTDEVLIGAPNAGDFAYGQAYLFYGGQSGPLDLADADAIFACPADYSCGQAVADLGDTDGDGVHDMGIDGGSYSGTSGILYVVPGKMDHYNTAVADSSSSIYGSAGTHASVGTAGNFENSGTEDWLLGSPYGSYSSYTGYGVVNLYADTGTVQYYQSTSSSGLLGWDVAGGARLNSDSYADFVATMPGYSYGYIYTVAGKATPTTTTISSAATATVYGQTSGDYFGNSVAIAGDFDGDGYDEIVAGAYLNDTSKTNGGRVYVYGGTTSGSISSVADLTVTASANNEYVGTWVDSAGDVDGDGLSDIVYGVPYSDKGATDGGEAGLVLGGASGSITIADADARIYSTTAYAYAGTAVAGVGDVDGDGFDDLVIGAPYMDTPADAAGEAWLFHGPLDGNYATTTADFSFAGLEANDNFGMTIAKSGDQDADGYADFIIGAPNSDWAGGNGGRVSLYYGPEVNLDFPMTLTPPNTSYNYLGSDVGMVGDLDGDGNDEVGFTGVYSTYYGFAWLVYGPGVE